MLFLIFLKTLQHIYIFTRKCEALFQNGSSYCLPGHRKLFFFGKMLGPVSIPEKALAGVWVKFQDCIPSHRDLGKRGCLIAH